MEVIVRYLRRDWEATATWSFPRLRADLDARPYPRTNVRKVEVRDDELGGVTARWFIPSGASDSSAIVYLHGGSYVYGSARSTHADVIARLARMTGVTAIGLDYRLAPEHPYPAQLEDALCAFNALSARGVKHIVVAGDSAGGNLAIMLQLRLRDLGQVQAVASVLISPWSDLTMPARSFEENDAYDYGTRAILLTQAKAFAGEISLDDARLSPVRAKLDGLSPTFIAVGSVEIPRDDILALARALENAGVEVTTHVAEDLPHFPLIFADYHKAAAACADAIARFVRARLRPD
jgi:acetyl esterase/lipase